VPRHWHHYTVRRSPLTRSGHSPRNAADPINALLNYGYALAEAEARIAALTVGLDPGLGILHTDQKHRDSLALDLLEALRPVVERHVLTLTTNRTFRATDFEETRDGRCRLRQPLTHDVAEQLLPELSRTVAAPAEAVAHMLATNSPGKDPPEHTTQPREHHQRTGARSAQRPPPRRGTGTDSATHLREVWRRPLRQRPQALPHLLARRPRRLPVPTRKGKSQTERTGQAHC
jgi:CRISPR associated protein Cas1